MLNLKVYIETYGCQMNVADSEVVVAILVEAGYEYTEQMVEADLILVNTCSVRENAEQRVRGRLKVFNTIKKKKPELLIGVIGCMAERLKEQLLEEEKMIDLVVGPDAYRELPLLIQTAESGQKAINTLLSREETYADISPVRVSSNGVSAFISIMRGCENMCTYCIVPYTRGAERSRHPQTIVSEAENLFEQGYREITLLGQNVDSYHWNNTDLLITDFADLLEKVARVNPKLRIRFATSHPKDLSDKALRKIAEFPNICRSIHLPVQSGSSRMLEIMNRGYTREWYLERIAAIKRIVPDCALSTDIMVGFCGETDEDQKDTLSLMKQVGYDYAFMFKYSERPKTYAARKLKDDVSEEIKLKRLKEVIALQNDLSGRSKNAELGRTFEVLVEGFSKKSKSDLVGRTSQNKVVVFPAEDYKKGDYVRVKIEKCTSATLIGRAV